MKNPLAMCRLQRVGYLNGKVEQNIDFDWFARQPALKGLAFQQFHCDEMPTFGLPTS